MNQILYKCELENLSNSYTMNKRKFSIIFFISIITLTITILFFFIMKYNFSKTNNISKSIVSNFNIKTLYNNDYTSNFLNTNTSTQPFVIGLIEIDKINIVYPIISTTTEELLNLSPCRFSGPMANEIGNLCIAGHNYSNNTHFGKIDVLSNDDIIKIYDINGNFLNYKIYNIYETKYNDLSCTSQNTNGLKEVTLITCNNINGNRIIVKAKEETK